MSGKLTELPFGLKGHIFGSPMPFGAFDQKGDLYHQFKSNQIETIVLLLDDEDYKEKSGLDLRSHYLNDGYQVLYLPIRDFDLPNREDLKSLLDTILDRAKVGRNIVIHCYAGRGRTGLVIACAAKQHLGLSGKDAIAWVRRYITGAIETTDQEQFVVDF